MANLFFYRYQVDKSMAEYKRPESEEEFKNNFNQKNPLMNDTEAFYESARCLFCYDAPCIKACPTGIDIPLFIKQIHSDNVEGASKTIYESNWLGNACGAVCPTEVLCEGSCVYQNQNVPVIQIGRLQNYATHKSIQKNKPLFERSPPNGKKVAAIGSGPASLACASELRMMGFEVDIYEAKALPSGLSVYGVAPYKITNDEVLDEVRYLEKQMGFHIHYNHPINSEDQLRELEESYDAIFLGVGIGPTARLGIPGEDKVNVIGAVEFIEELRMKHHEVKVPNHVVIIGGGNTAVDAASECARMGAESTTLAYRRDKSSMGAYAFEYKMAKSSGVVGMFHVAPVEILGDQKVEGIRLIKTSSDNGRLKEVDGSEFVIPCELVIKATGQAKHPEFLNKINGLELDNKNRIVVNPASYQSRNPKYFAGGDAVNGGAEIVNGAYEGKMAALGIYQYVFKG